MAQEAQPALLVVIAGNGAGEPEIGVCQQQQIRLPFQQGDRRRAPQTSGRDFRLHGALVQP